MTISVNLENLLQGRRLTPGQRRIAQCLIEHRDTVGFLSSGDLAQRASVSQPSVTRFAMALGFDGYLDMRRQLLPPKPGEATSQKEKPNRYQAAALAEASNLADLATTLSDAGAIRRIGAALAKSRPLVVLGLRASAGLASQFSYYAAKVHPDIRPITDGGSLVEDKLEQAKAAGCLLVLAFMMPLYPRETVSAMRFARSLGLEVALVTDSTFTNHSELAEHLIRARINSSLVSDSYAAFSVLVAALVDAMCDAIGRVAQDRLDAVDRSSKRRNVFTT